MTLPHAEQTSGVEHTPDGDTLPIKPTWQHWFEGFQTMCAAHNIDPAVMTADWRPFFATITADHLHHDTADYYSRQRALGTEHDTAPSAVPLPHRMIHSRLLSYYHQFPPQPVDARRDSVEAISRRRHHAHYLTLAQADRNHFREIRIAERLSAHFADVGQDEAAEAVQELLTAYGMVDENLRAYANNAIHPPHLIGTARAAQEQHARPTEDSEEAEEAP